MVLIVYALTVVTIVASLVLVFWVLPKFLLDYYRKCRVLRNFPKGDIKPHWLLGDIANVRSDEETVRRLIAYVRSRNVRVVSGWIGPFVPILTVIHPEPARKVLKEPKLRRVYNLFHPWLGDGLLTVQDGPKWQRNRHLLTPAFHFSILRSYIPVYNNCLRQLFSKWDTSVRSNQPVLLFNTVSSFSLDIILQCAFSFKSNCQMDGEQPPYIKAVYQLAKSVSDRFLNIFYHIDWVYFLTPAGRRMRAACQVVHSHAEMVIKERRQVLGLDQGIKAINSQNLLDKITKSRKLDFLDILLTASDENGVGMTDLEIRNEVDTFMFEGHDTTTSGMCWTLYCLAKHPDCQEKVREEVRSVLAGREWLEYDNLKDLKYTQCCIKEAMRLYPPVFLIMREVKQEIELEGHKIPKGVWLSIPIVTMHHNQNVWPNPEVYDPTRFEMSNSKNRDIYAYLAFSAGNRNCIGQNFALNEEKVSVASIMNRYRVKLVEEHTVEMLPLVTMRAKNDIKLRLEPLL